MSEAKKFDDVMCPVEDQPFLFDFSEDLNEIDDDIASITSITIDATAAAAGFEQHDSTITDVNNDSRLTVNGGVTVWFKVATIEQSNVYWNNPGNEVCITCLILTTGGISLALTGLLTVSQPC